MAPGEAPKPIPVLAGRPRTGDDPADATVFSRRGKVPFRDRERLPRNAALPGPAHAVGHILGERHLIRAFARQLPGLFDESRMIHVEVHIHVVERGAARRPERTAAPAVQVGEELPCADFLA